MTNKLRPLLATEVKYLKDLKLPMLASIKLDGIYALIVDGVIYSRSFKPIKNKHVQKLFDPTKLKQAHEWCREKTEMWLVS